MNLNVLSALVAEALPPSTEGLLGTIPTLLNEALNQIQQRRSFNCMKLTYTFSLSLVGNPPYAVALPSTFKELQSGANSLRATDPDQLYGNSMWRIFTSQEVKRMRAIGVSVADRMAWIDQGVSGIWSIYFPGPLDAGYLPAGTGFEVDIYSFLAPVSLPTDENDLMRRYPMLVLEWAKMLVFSVKSDEVSIAAKNECLGMINGKPGFTGYFVQASADDASHAVRGRTSRMGGF